MENSLFVYQLIASLSKSEKRYVMLQAGYHRSQSHLLQLFKLISKESIGDDVTLKKHLKDASFSAQTDVLKVYLHQFIMNSLHNYHRNVGYERKLNDALIDIQLLFDKKLYSNCRTVLNKTKQLAVKTRQLSFSLALLDWERKLSNASPTLQLKKAAARFESATRLITSKINREAAHNDLLSGIELQRYQFLVHPDLLSKQKLREQLLILEISRPNEAFQPSIQSLSTSINANAIIGNYELVFQENSQLIEYYFENPYLLETQWQHAIKAIELQITTCIRLNEFTIAFMYLLQLGNLPAYLNKAVRRSIQFRHIFMANQLLCCLKIVTNTGDQNAIKKLIAAINPYQRIIAKLNFSALVMDIDFTLLHAYFVIHDITNTNIYCKRILEKKQPEFHEHIITAQFINFMANYDAKNEQSNKDFFAFYRTLIRHQHFLNPQLYSTLLNYFRGTANLPITHRKRLAVMQINQLLNLFTTMQGFRPINLQTWYIAANNEPDSLQAINARIIDSHTKDKMISFAYKLAQ